MSQVRRSQEVVERLMGKEGVTNEEVEAELMDAELSELTPTGN